MSELYGRICSINDSYFEVFTTLKSHITVKCIYKVKFFPIRVGDSIHCSVEEYRKEFLKLVGIPWVIISCDKENIVATLAKALGKSRKDPELLYDKLLGYIKILENVGKEQEFKHGDQKLIEFLNNKSSNYYLDFNFSLPDCNYQLTKQILNVWYEDRVLRQLYLYGLNKKEIMGYIKYSRKTANDLIKLCYERPTAIFSIDSDKLGDIIERTKPLVTESDIKYNGLARKLYQNLQSGDCRLDRKDLKDPEIVILADNYNIICDNDNLYLSYVYYIQEKISYYFTIIYRKIEIKNYDTSKIPAFLNKEQKVAFEMAISNSLVSIPGPAGSGKSTLIRELYRYFVKMSKTVILSSLTGKAVSLLREKTGSDSCMTLHSLIKSLSNKMKIKIDVLIIDEASMLTGELLYKILSNLAPYYPQLIFCFDYNQLPPISWGAMDLTKLDHVSYLTFSERFSGPILANSQRVLEGKQVIDDDVFKFLDGNMETVIELYKNLTEDEEDLNIFQILSPYNKSVDEINSKIQALRQKEKEWAIDKAGRRWTEDDNIIFLENNSEIDVFNGETGKIIKVTDEKVTVKFGNKHPFDLKLSEEESQEDDFIPSNPDKFIEYTPRNQLSTKLIKLSYCLTVHKAQGSEWPIVILYLPFNSSDFVNRNLIYSAITRCRSAIFIVGKILQFSSCCKKIAKNFPLDIKTNGRSS